MDKKTITIVLDDTYNATEFDANSFIHIDSFHILETIIDNHLNKHRVTNEDKEKLKNNYEKNFKKERGHYTITVLGGRGSGKSSFLLTSLLMVSGSSKGLINLGILDPTLIDNKEHLLLSIITLIQQKINDKHSSKDNHCKSKDNTLKDWHDSLKDLAKGLKLLDGVGTDWLKKELWDDPVTIMTEGLKDSLSSIRLNENFHKFIEESAKALGVYGFIIGLDDIDTNFEKGLPVLEALRKYLTTPRLISIVSGDMALYSAQVRKYQWEQLGDLVTKYENEKEKYDYHNMVDRLEEQYLVKVLPSHQRIELQTVAEIKIKFNWDIQVGGYSENVRIYIEDLILAYFGFKKNDADFKYYEVFILSQPLRSLLQLLQLVFNVENNSGEQKPVLNDALYVLSNLSYIYGLHEIGSAKQKEVNTLVASALKIAYNRNLLIQDFELLPKYSNDDKKNNTSFLLSGFIYSALMKDNRHNQVSVMLKFGLVRAIIEKNLQNKDRFNIDEIFDWIDAFSIQNVVSFTRRWLSVSVELYKNQTVSILGVNVFDDFIDEKNINKIKKDMFNYSDLINDIEKKSQDKVIKEYIDENPYLFNEIDTESQEKRYKTGESLEKPLESKSMVDDLIISQEYCLSIKYYEFIDKSTLNNVLLFPFSRYYSANKTYVFASVFNLLGAFSDLINDIEKNSQDNINQFVFSLNKIGQLKRYPIFNADDSSGSINNKVKIDETKTSPKAVYLFDGVKDFDEKFYAAFSKWLKEYHKVVVLPPSIWSRIWQRFYHSLDQQSKSAGLVDKQFLGYLLHRQLVLFMNAVLVETSIYHKYQKEDFNFTKTLNLSNPIESDNIFKDNLKVWSDYRKKDNDFFKVFFACPLWGFFIGDDFDEKGGKLKQLYYNNMKDLGISIGDDLKELYDYFYFYNFIPLNKIKQD